MRKLDESRFHQAFREMITSNRWQEEPEYYPRYRTRYEGLLRRFAATAPPQPIQVLDIGGGQLAFLAAKIWGDDACVADVESSCFPGLLAHGIDVFEWNVALEDPPTGRQVDAIFFSEVIEHLPVPGHIALRRLRTLLRPGGFLLCSTPNLFRLRNVVYLLRGRPLFDHFGLPEERGYGHVLEYTAEHLEWQLRRAGFAECAVELEDFSHVPNQPLDRALATIGAPLRRIERYRDNLVAVAIAP